MSAHVETLLRRFGALSRENSNERWKEKTFVLYGLTKKKMQNNTSFTNCFTQGVKKLKQY